MPLIVLKFKQILFLIGFEEIKSDRSANNSVSSEQESESITHISETSSRRTPSQG